MKLNALTLIYMLLFLCTNTLTAQDTRNTVRITGQMKDVMWKGEIAAKIDLDTIRNKEHLFGLGPVEYLSGELMVVDGVCYKSTVISESAMKVERGFQTKAPFFGCANIEKWNTRLLPDSVQTMTQLEAFLNDYNKNTGTAFMFRLKGTIAEAVIHIQNLPPGSEVKSPADAKKGQVKYTLRDEDCEILGFFSTQHQGIFTHHGHFVHMHLLTADKSKMGHIDELSFRPQSMKLLLPAD